VSERSVECGGGAVQQDALLGLFERLVGRDVRCKLECAVWLGLALCRSPPSLSCPPRTHTLSSTEMRELTYGCSKLARG